MIHLGGGFKDFLFSPLFGEMIHFDQYFSDGWFNHQLDFHATVFHAKVAKQKKTGRSPVNSAC